MRAIGKISIDLPTMYYPGKIKIILYYIIIITLLHLSHDHASVLGLVGYTSLLEDGPVVIIRVIINVVIKKVNH